jgi:hypothetical protein
MNVNILRNVLKHSLSIVVRSYPINIVNGLFIFFRLLHRIDTAFELRPTRAGAQPEHEPPQ